jgi:hypothetical protein
MFYEHGNYLLSKSRDLCESCTFPFAMKDWSKKRKPSFGLFVRLIFFFFCIVGVESRSTRHCGHLMAYCVSPGWLWQWRNRWNDWQGKPKYSEKTCPSAALPTKNPTCCPYANPGRRGGKPASIRWAAARPEVDLEYILWLQHHAVF